MSVEMLNASEFMEEVLNEVRDGMDEVADEMMGELLLGVSEKLPVEDGHAHEAFESASNSIASKLKYSRHINHAIGPFTENGSNDPLAKQHGEGLVSRTEDSISVDLNIHLSFVYKLEYGLPIKVGDLNGNKGRKEANVPRKTLYGPRETEGMGLLVWKENGVTHRASIRSGYGAFGFLRHGIQRILNRFKEK